jgi:hypothetical protein
MNAVAAMAMINPSFLLQNLRVMTTSPPLASSPSPQVTSVTPPPELEASQPGTSPVSRYIEMKQHRALDLSRYVLNILPHAYKQAELKRYSPDIIARTYDCPNRVYPSKSHPGQYRITGNGICLVGEPVGDHFNIITIYKDMILTPPRDDQMETPEGRRYAERFNQGLGRG